MRKNSAVSCLVLLVAISEPGWTSRKKVPLGVRLKSTRPSEIQERPRWKFPWGEIQNDDVECTPHIGAPCSARKAPAKVVTSQYTEFDTKTRFRAAISPQTKPNPPRDHPDPPHSRQTRAERARSTGGDRRRPEATGGDRRRPEATGGDRRRPEATGGEARGKNPRFYSRRKNNNAKRLRPTAATPGRRRRSQRRLHAPTAIPPPLPPLTTATRDRAEKNTSAEAEASGGGQRRTCKEYNTQRNQRQKQRQQRERREDRKKQTAHCRAGDLRSQRGVQRRAHSELRV